MDTAVADLATNSGPLVAVKGVPAAAGRHRELEFEFTAGVLTLRCDDDTDALVAEVGRHGEDAESIGDSWAQGLLGKWIEYAWGLRNHRGYNDGFQLRLMHDGREEEPRHFEVAGSVIAVLVVTSGNAAS